ncbi:MAG: right-handed parallel beta-helix repeat-containing protein [Clostridiales bacterium]|nr:right-handed parallel beta-helix repeat-containing protein [Clostridiales bacterium]
MKDRMLFLTLLLLCLVLPLGAQAADAQGHILDATADLAPMAQGTKADGDTELVGDFFTIHYSEKTKIDSSSKTFDDGYTATQRINFGGKTQPGKGMINTVRFTTQEAATLRFWWVSGGDTRQFALYDAQGTILQRTTVDSVKNALYISDFAISNPGTYYLGVPDGSNYLFKMQLTTAPLETITASRRTWAAVDYPMVFMAEDKQDGTMEVTVYASIGYDGGDEVIVSMLDEAGQVVASRRSIADKGEHILTFAPPASGRYSFSATLNREGEEGKTDPGISEKFVLPLGTPVISSATSVGGGSVALVWTEVPEATGYEVFVNGTSCASCETTAFTVSGLPIGEAAVFTVRAIRGDEAGQPSAGITAIPTQEAQRAWSFVVYGPSTNAADNGYVGSINEQGSVTVYSENGKGKIQPNADDGVSFYYTAIPADKNFTLRAHVHVDAWDYSNGQEGFGLMAADSVPAHGAASFLTNQYMALASKIEYYFENGRISASGQKYTMRLGLGVLSKLGRTPETQSAILGVTYPLETSAAMKSVEGVGNYNIIGNNTNRDVLDKTALTIAELTDFDLAIQRNNTGYFITYYGEDGSIIGQYKDYDPDALTKLDAEQVYVGFFAARRARATFSDVTLTVLDPAEDAPAEEKPVERITPSVTIVSGSTSGNEVYPLSWVSNVAGTVDVYITTGEGDQALAASGLPSVAEIRNDYALTLPATGEMLLEVVLTPDPDVGEGRALTSEKAVSAEAAVVYTNMYATLSEICVSPNGTPSGRGTPDSPLTLATAVQYVRPGQTILLAEGTYNFVSALRIPHGIDGTADAPIRMIADPSAATRPVLDFKGLSAGIIHGGDYWYFQGFDVTGAANGQKGFQVSGHHNILEGIQTYHNGNTGIQISRYAGSDPVSDWPSHNLILNCTSWGNADAGYEDADGFAAKLTCGEGNVFVGCVAHHNADDGFDLYAKPETGPIGAVTLEDCVAYANGILEDGTIAGNGNGFKMGGSNMPGGHQLLRSYAFFNRSKGIDANSCPDVTVADCVSYNNLRYNVALYTNIEQNTAYQATGVISFKDATIDGGDPSLGDELKPRGTQDAAAIRNDSCFYWDGAHAVNASGQELTAEDFVSLEFKGVNRHVDGSIDLQGFLQRLDAAQ